MKRAIRLAGTTLKWGTLLMTLAFVVCILVQIYARLFLETAPSWTEEAARLFFLLSVGFAAGLAYKSDYYVYFDFLYARMGAAARGWLTLTIDLMTVLLFVLFVYYAVQFTAMGVVERSPSLKFPMVIAFASMVVLGLSILLFAVQRLLSHLPTRSA
jgi:TRAP-type C4-dicarboxylate transport system permease small subunit